LMADLAAQRIEPEQRDRLDVAMGRMRASLPSDMSPGDLVGYRDAAHQFGKILSEASGNEVARCVVETIDVPAPEGQLDEELAAMAKTQEFAERLYARIVRGTESGNGIESVGAASEEQSADADVDVDVAPTVSLPSQPPLRTTPLRRRPGVDARPPMVGVGSGTRSLL
jgi:hypothetical protein